MGSGRAGMLSRAATSWAFLKGVNCRAPLFTRWFYVHVKFNVGELQQIYVEDVNETKVLME